MSTGRLLRVLYIAFSARGRSVVAMVLDQFKSLIVALLVAATAPAARVLSVKEAT